MRPGIPLSIVLVVGLGEAPLSGGEAGQPESGGSLGHFPQDREKDGSASRPAPLQPFLGRPPLSFVENRGQWPTSARFVARRAGRTVRLEEDAIALQLETASEDGRIRGVVVRLAIEGACAPAQLVGEEPREGVYNFFLGNDPAAWRVGVPSYGAVLYRGLAEGVDARFREEEGHLEYDLLLAPGADLERIVLRCEGSTRLEIGPDGSLWMHTDLGSLRQSPPRAWLCEASGVRRPVDCVVRRVGENRFGFDVPGRDPGLPLTIDPGLEWSTYLGTSGEEGAVAVVVDAAGAVVVAGFTTSVGFPTTAGAFDTTLSGVSDAFVTRLNAAGNGLLYSTFLGGPGGVTAHSLSLGSAGEVAVVGLTASTSFPTTTGAFDTSFNGNLDAFVARLDASGSALVYSSYLGGSNVEGFAGLDVALGPSGEATVVGATMSANFPTTAGAYDTTLAAGEVDGFVTRFSPSGGSLVYSTFLGNTGTGFGENISAVAVDGSGDATVAGGTLPGTLPFPTTPGAFDTTNSAADGFVARLDPSGSTLVFSTFLGGSVASGPPAEGVTGLALDGSGAVIVAGTTNSADFPTSPSAFDTTFNGGCLPSSVPSPCTDAFVARLDATGSALLYSTFLGGSGFEDARALASDRSGAATVLGYTRSTNFPATPGTYDPTFASVICPYSKSFAPCTDLFVTRLNAAGTSLLYSTALGGSEDEFPYAIALDVAGAAVVVGNTPSPDFPTTPGAFDPAFNGGGSAFSNYGDAFVSKLEMLPAGIARYGASTPGCAGPLAIGVTGWAQVGNAAFGITCANAPANGAGSLGLSGGPASPGFFLAGVLVSIDPSAFIALVATSNSLGASEVALPVPADPALAGLDLYTQFFWLDACGPQGTSASNALEMAVQP